MTVIVVLFGIGAIFFSTQEDDKQTAAAKICSPFAYDLCTDDYIICKSINTLGYEIKLWPNKK